MFCPGHTTPGLGSYHYNHNIPLSVLGQDQVLFLILPDSPLCALSSPSCYLFIAKSVSFMDRDCLSPHPSPSPNASLNWLSQKNRIQPTFWGRQLGTTPAVPQISGSQIVWSQAALHSSKLLRTPSMGISMIIKKPPAESFTTLSAANTKSTTTAKRSIPAQHILWNKKFHQK